MGKKNLPVYYVTFLIILTAHQKISSQHSHRMNTTQSASVGKHYLRNSQVMLIYYKITFLWDWRFLSACRYFICTLPLASRSITGYSNRLTPFPYLRHVTLPTLPSRLRSITLTYTNLGWERSRPLHTNLKGVKSGQRPWPHPLLDA